MNTVLGVSAAVTAVATIALAVITGFLALYAWRQISSAREDAKIGRTLAACEKYDLDPVLCRCLVRLRKADERGTFNEDPQPYYKDVLSVLNYFESIVIAIDRKLYDAEIVRDHFAEIFQAHFDDYFGDEAPKVIKEDWFAQDDFARYKRICQEWSK